MPDMDELLRLLMKSQAQMINLGRPGKKDVSSWVQVGKLTSEEMLEFRASTRMADEMARKAEILDLKIKALSGKVTVRGKAFWAKLHASHSLPPASYHISDDGRILMEPTAPKEVS